MKKLYPIFLLSLTLLYGLHAQGQSSVVVSGVIKGSNGLPIPSVTVVEKGNPSNGTISDLNGNFSLRVQDESAVLSFSTIGFKTKEIQVGKHTTLDVLLEDDVKGLNEVVVVGYGTQKKREIAGAIASVSSKDLKDQPSVNLEQAIVGKMAGVQVIQNTGAPGGSLTVRVRGLSSITAGSEPLYVIDGFPVSNDARDIQLYLKPVPSVLDNQYQKAPNTTSSFNMDDVASIDVLKDASSAAIYGSRGSGGVVIITTKKGSRDGKPTVNYNEYYGIQQVSKVLPMLNAYQWSILAREGKINAYWDKLSTLDYAGAANYVDTATPDPNSFYTIPNELKPYLQGQPGLTDTNWQNAIFRTAPTQNHTVSFSGGTEKIQYYISGNYLDQQGIMVGSAFNRLGFKANITAQVSPKLKIGASLTPTRTQYDLINSEGPWSQEGIMSLVLKASPIFPVYNPNGSFAVDRQNTWNGRGSVINYGCTVGENPVAEASLIKDKLINIRLFNNFFAEYEFIKGLTFKSYLGTDITFSNRNYFHPSTLGYSNLYGAPVASGNPANDLAFSQAGYALNWLWENTLSYKFTHGDHHFNFLAGYTSQKATTNVTFGSGSNFPSDAFTTLNAAGTILSATTDAQAWSLLSYLARGNYSYKEKYFVTATIRADGSSRFGPNNKWGVFPSASAAWNIASESFFKSQKISELKLRASYGYTGNFQIPNYGSFATLGSNQNYALGGDTGNPVLGTTINSLGNPSLKWEKTAQLNLGVDAGVLNNRIEISLDYYRSETSNLLLNVPVGLSSGYPTSLQNVGQVQNQGLELGLSTVNIDATNFRWNSQFNIYGNRNEVISLGPGNTPIVSSGGVAQEFITQVGKPIGNYYGYSSKGVIQNPDQLAAYRAIYRINTNIPQLGDRMFADVNKDGQVNSNDRTIIGNFQPKFLWGFTNNFTYKAFDVSVALQGSQGGRILDLQRRYNYNSEGNNNQLASAFSNRYIDQAHPGNGIIIRENRLTNASSQAVNSTFVEDGSYTRIRSIVIGYTLSGLLNDKIKKLRMYVSGQNLWTFSNYLLYNPEANARPTSALTQGEDYASYPLAKTFIFGLNATF